MVYLSKYQSHHHNSPTLLLILQNIDQEKKKRGTGSYFGFQLDFFTFYQQCNFGISSLSITRTHSTKLYINLVNSFVKNPIVNTVFSVVDPNLQMRGDPVSQTLE